MAYCTLDDLKNAKAEKIIRELSGGGASIDTGVTTAAIEYADGKIDFYIGNRYTVPLTAPVPQFIKDISVGLAICFMYGRQHTRPEDVKTDCESYISTLEKIQEGTGTIPGISADDAKVTQPFEDEKLGEYTANKFDMTTLDES